MHLFLIKWTSVFRTSVDINNSERTCFCFFFNNCLSLSSQAFSSASIAFFTLSASLAAAFLARAATALLFSPTNFFGILICDTQILKFIRNSYMIRIISNSRVFQISRQIVLELAIVAHAWICSVKAVKIQVIRARNNSRLGSIKQTVCIVHFV